MHVCHVNTNFQLGGAETVMHQLHRGCLAQGVRSTLGVAHAGKARLLPRHTIRLYPALLEYLQHTRAHRWIEYFVHRNSWTNRAFGKLLTEPFDLFHIHSFTGYATIASLVEAARRKPV